MLLKLRMWLAGWFFSKKERRDFKELILNYQNEKEYAGIVQKSMKDGTFWNIMMGKNHMPDDPVQIVNLQEEHKVIAEKPKNIYLGNVSNESAAEWDAGIDDSNYVETNGLFMQKQNETQVISLRPEYKEKMRKLRLNRAKRVARQNIKKFSEPKKNIKKSKKR